MAASSLAAALIHLALTNEHLEEWAPLGMAFLLTGLAQASAAVAVFIRESSSTYRMMIAVSAAPLVIWGFSRIWGLPAGPDAWVPEHIEFQDLVAVACEGVVVLLVIAKLKGWVLHRRLPSIVVSVVAPMPIFAAMVSLRAEGGHQVVEAAPESLLAHALPLLIGSASLAMTVMVRTLRRSQG